ncbi:MAG: 16S rRNA (adenine(1518)-N(6)/adenine(1519)-N(6))-dimethyltransferase, partial [Elusimicrobia bacterium]|nr:16S rRNA (adenine(1518)-N(6)/adenine(1519)-N(6))-dimethyltransferase [Elusimicrobiota bacterium]
MGNSARLSQHFLEDEAARQAIVAAVRPAGRRVLEIGPGRGALSEPLLEGGAALTAVELDDRLCEGLRPLLGRG